MLAEKLWIEHTKELDILEAICREDDVRKKL
jgi:hypothetical protein